MDQPVTVKDIAQLAGVSIGTVDRVLHGRGRVAEKTKAKIRKIIRETGYTPNLHASNLAHNKTCTIAVLTPQSNQDSGFWYLPHRGMRRAVEDLSPFSVRLSFHCFNRFSEQSFQNACRDLAVEHPNGILFAPIMPLPIDEISTLLPKHVPVCCFDSDLPELDKIGFIGQEPKKSGHLAAKLMRMLTGDKGSTVIAQAVKADYHIRGRVDGFIEGFPEQKSPRVYQEEHLENPATCSAFMETLIKAEPSLKGIFVPNASGHFIAKHLETNRMRGIHLIGYDLIDRNVEYLKKGVIDFLISQRPELQGYRGVLRLFDAFKGRLTGEVREIMPMDILTAENIDYYTPFK